MSTRKEKIPTVRFRAFSEPWFQNQLSEVAEFSKGRGYSKKDIQPQGTPIILYGRLYTKYESVISNIDTYANMEKNSVISEGGEVIIPASGESAAEISRASCVTDGGVILGGDINIVKPHESLASSFIAITLSNGSQQRELSKCAQGKSVVHLHNSDLKAVKLFYPSYEEQSAIGTLFRTLDDLLSSYKDNLTNYQSLKATMLSKMFPKVGQTVPEIRLNGFEGEWVEKRLKDISKRVTRKNNDLVSERALTISAQFGLIDQEEFFQKKIASKDVSGYYLIKKGEFAYNKSYSTGYPLGAIKRLDKYENGVLSTLYILFKAVDIDSDYLAHYYESDKWHREVSMCAAEGARNHGLLNIAPADFFNTRLVIPKELAEQQAIGAYFSNLDNLINSYQEKITQLETLKKKLLQDMFI
jgi:hsdS-like protein of type I restriction-modification system